MSMMSLIIRHFSSSRPAMKSTSRVNLASTIFPSTSQPKSQLFFLHGLLGNRYNLLQLAKDPFIAQNYTSHLLDMRNHGDSDHCPTMSYREMAQDIIHYADTKRIAKFSVCGHSMGGKIAMTLAPLVPERVESVVVLDAPPKDVTREPYFLAHTKPAFDKLRKFVHPNGWDETVKGLYEAFKDKEKVFAVLLERNLIKEGDKAVWKCNMNTIFESLDMLFGFEHVGKYYGKKVLIVMGEKSVQYNLNVFQAVFPDIDKENITIVSGAGHWVHADKPKEVRKLISNFLHKSVYSR
eukprot:TRINITY_DN1786_c0_g1_i1.p2 TRINITY_DN1786_c0_g1~~TRINITY_DN1786_c0_g1_i1.p2  ORF type:complete len:294 (-),score=19.43 TRINITY_DN1786_c0_g1_i1:33-914(-)